jgi:hypothetical protein
MLRRGGKGLRGILLFLKKKKQKDFSSVPEGKLAPALKLPKVFWFFFPKKNIQAG